MYGRQFKMGHCSCESSVLLWGKEGWCEVLVYERKYGVCLVFGEAKMAYGLGGVIYILIAGRRKQCSVI